MSRSMRFGLYCALAMFVNLIVGPLGLFAYWGWPDFPTWDIGDRRFYWIFVEGLMTIAYFFGWCYAGEKQS
jgi:hypothetical protein